jgi:predicted transport protein
MYWYPMEQIFRRSEHMDHTNQFDRFMRDYLTIKQGSIPNIDRVYHSFKTYHRSTKETPVAQIMADIDRYARYFVNMAFLQEKDEDIRHLLADIHALKVQVAYPFLLEVYDDYAQKLLSREDFIAILKLIESYVFRRVICGVPTNSMNKTFATLAKEIDKEHYLASVQAAFLRKDSHRRFPKDEEFRAEFMVKDIYNLSLRNYVLRKLEHHGSKERVNVEDCTIEHIMPQNEHLSPEWQAELGPNWKEVHARYLHTIGNLTLTGYNSELSNRPFRKKRDMKGGFAKSPIRLNESLATVEQWNEGEIKKRAVALAALAVQIWAVPQVPPVLVDEKDRHAQEGETEVISSIDHPHAEKGVRDAPKKNIPSSRNGGVGTAPPAKPIDDTGSYSLEDHLRYMPVNIRGIFERLRKRILNLDSSVKEEVRKHYIAYKTTTDFVAIELQKKQLRVTLHVRLSEMNDPKGLCKIVVHPGHLNNGNVEISIHSLDQIEDGMDLIRQAFEKQAEEIYT